MDPGSRNHAPPPGQKSRRHLGEVACGRFHRIWLRHQAGAADRPLPSEETVPPRVQGTRCLSITPVLSCCSFNTTNRLSGQPSGRLAAVHRPEPLLGTVLMPQPLTADPAGGGGTSALPTVGGCQRAGGEGAPGRSRASGRAGDAARFRFTTAFRVSHSTTRNWPGESPERSAASSHAILA
jgi:hypothetical protein